MPIKKIIHNFIWVSLLFGLVYFFYMFYDMKNKLIAKNDYLYQMNGILESFHLYSLEQHYLNLNGLQNSLSLITDSTGRFRADEVLLDNSFVILIPENTCEICVDDILDHVNQVFLPETKVYLMIETPSFKKLSIVKNNITRESIKIIGFEKHGNSKLWNYDLPICFLYKEGDFISSFIPIVGHSQRTVEYLELIQNILLEL